MFIQGKDLNQKTPQNNYSQFGNLYIDFYLYTYSMKYVENYYNNFLIIIMMMTLKLF